MRHELAQLAGKIDWDFIDGEITPLYSDSGRPGIATRFVIGFFCSNRRFCGRAAHFRETNCVAGHIGLSKDQSRLSCGAGAAQLVPSREASLRGRC
jgi:hypothetical protein